MSFIEMDFASGGGTSWDKPIVAEEVKTVTNSGSTIPYAYFESTELSSGTVLAICYAQDAISSRFFVAQVSSNTYTQVANVGSGMGCTYSTNKIGFKVDDGSAKTWSLQFILIRLS